MFVFDLDGTIALNEHRQHFVERPKGEKDWDSFTKACVDDTPNHPLVTIMHCLRVNGHKIAVLSGRGMAAYDDTIEWLSKHNVPYDYISMRPIKDHSDDCDLKLAMMGILKKKYPSENIEAVFDDRKKVVDMWRENGFKCFQVAAGDF